MKHITIDLELRKDLDISYTAYMICEVVLRSYRGRETKEVIKDTLLLPQANITTSLNDLETMGYVIITGDNVEASIGLRRAFSLTQDIEVEPEEVVSRVQEISNTFVNYINEMTGQSLSAKGTCTKLVRKILKAHPNYTEHHFTAVVDDAVRKWYGDPKMGRFIHYTTLLRSVSQFDRYLDEARDNLRSQQNAQ